jgi:hypothetical protein
MIQRTIMFWRANPAMRLGATKGSLNRLGSSGRTSFPDRLQVSIYRNCSECMRQPERLMCQRLNMADFVSAVRSPGCVKNGILSGS